MPETVADALIVVDASGALLLLAYSSKLPESAGPLPVAGAIQRASVGFALLTVMKWVFALYNVSALSQSIAGTAGAALAIGVRTRRDRRANSLEPLSGTIHTFGVAGFVTADPIYTETAFTLGPSSARFTISLRRYARRVLAIQSVAAFNFRGARIKTRPILATNVRATVLSRSFNALPSSIAHPGFVVDMAGAERRLTYR